MVETFWSDSEKIMGRHVNKEHWIETRLKKVKDKIGQKNDEEVRVSSMLQDNGELQSEEETPLQQFQSPGEHILVMSLDW